MTQFPHLKFIQKITGRPRISGGGGTNPITRQNKENRAAHSNLLRQSSNSIKSDWHTSFQEREAENLASIDGTTVPIFLKINPDIITADFALDSYGIEIISEEDDGFIIGASNDNLRSLEEKISSFIEKKRGSAKIADFWQIIDGKRDIWKPEHILSEGLFAQWPNIQDNRIYDIEVSVAFSKPIIKLPDPTKRGFEQKSEKADKLLIERDEQFLERQTHFEKFIEHYGEITSSFSDLEDSFSCQVSISGKGLKDLVINYQYVFEVTEIEEIKGLESRTENLPEAEIEVLPPDKDATVVGVIDSGIMGNHKYISSAINQDSKSYVENDKSTADHVKGGGHGTKVAGAILFPQGITHLESPYKLPCFIRNLRVLDRVNILRDKYPTILMDNIIHDNQDCKIFNLSVNSKAPFRRKHMSTWAAVIDKLSHDNDILFVISTGNIHNSYIQHCLKEGIDYPEFLKENFCRIANPAQSSFCLTVGSINITDFKDDNWISLGVKDDISAFSRIGTGIWNSIKPDVVEYGGGLIVSKNAHKLVRNNSVTSPELLRSTLHGGSAIGKDCVGTSFSAPKITSIAAILKQLYPEENVNLIRALIVQGARLPNDFFHNPTKLSMQYFGYGLPSIERVTKNSDYRATFYNSGKIKAEEGHIYALKIPDVIRGPGDEFDILIEVTLAYSAQIRRTRQQTKSYLATWLDWISSGLDENFESFTQRSLVKENDEEYGNDTHQCIQWKIRERNDWGEIKDICRNNSSLQKDWAILKSYELPEELCFAIRGHKGWDKNRNKIPYAIVVSLEILGADIPIYEELRIENQIEIETEI